MNVTYPPRPIIVVVTSVLVAAGPVVAHENHTTQDSSGLAGMLPPMAFIISVLVASTALYLEHQGVIEKRWADVGVGLGFLGGLGSIALLL